MSIQSKVSKLTIAGAFAFVFTTSFTTPSLAFINQLDPALDTVSYKRLLDLQETTHLAEDIWSRLTNEFVSQYESGNYAQAAITAQVAYDLAEKSFGPNDVNTADSLLKLGIVTDTLGDTNKAKEYLFGALSILEDDLGSAHIDVAVVLTNLANIYFEEGNNSKSEEYHIRALKIRQQNLGANDPTVAQSMYNLAVLYDEIQDYDKAANLYEKAIEIWYGTIGQNHPHVANALNNLANVYVAKGEFEIATQLHKHSLSIRRQIYGNNHPEVARAIINLASLYVKMNDYDKAQPLYEEAVSLSEKLLGPTHPQVAMLLYSLANVYHIQGRMDYSAHHKSDDTASGNIQKAALTTQDDASNAYYMRALPLYERALAILDTSMQGNHPAITAMINEMAMLYKSIGKYEMAEQMQARLSHH